MKDMVVSGRFDNNRVLIVDDSRDIHRDFYGILVSKEDPADFQEMEQALFGDAITTPSQTEFQVDSAYQGQEALEMVQSALAEGQPYAVAFVDMRMPPGWDGLETIAHLWQADENLEVVICTAYSDYSWEKITERVSANLDKLLILKKPFDAIEVQQIATALVKKWNLGRQAEHLTEKLESLVEQRTSKLSFTEEQARRAEQRWRSLLDNAPNLILVFNEQEEVEFINHTIEGRFGLDGGRHEPFDFFDPQHHKQIRDSITRIFQTGEAAGYTVKGQMESGKEVWYEIQFGTIKENDLIVAATLIATDITERRDIEAQLLQAQKLEAIGRLAGGVAHDINNILSAILGSASVLELEIDPEDEKSEDIQRIITACRKGGRTTRDLLGFARKGKYLRERVSLNRLMLRIIELLKHTISKKISIELELDEKLYLVVGDLGQLDNALMNICLNALDAMQGEGRLIIRTMNHSVFSSDGDAAFGLPPGTYVRLQVEDTGAGMDEETRFRVFEPFFTTKSQGEGTGLGLAMVYGVVKNHGGIINVDSAPGEGTTVEVVLPCIDQLASELPEVPMQTVPSIVPERGGVLIVDDEEMLLSSTKRILNKMGYRVFLADNGRTAIDEFTSHRDEIDAVLLDMMMPELDGRETFFELKKIDPDVKILLCSGYSKDKKVEDLLSSGAIGFVHKPFDVKVLTDELKGVI